MLIDDVTIKVSAGNGGRGAVAFNKQAMSLGPTGGSGGAGGSVYFEGVSDLGSLDQFRYEKDQKAEGGENGKAQCNDGADGDDLILKIPVGTVITKVETNEVWELLKVGEKILVAKGGHGGKGNFLFRSSKNTSPRQFQEGLLGEHFTVRLNLKLIADVGLIGLPNAGKSSLLNELTKAKSKVANYAFTTLEPNLGVYYELIIADIPGLIEGASSGKGLGMKFLRHVERTKILFHLISAESKTPVKDYRVIKKELKTYSGELVKKPEYVFLSKSDMVSAADVKKKVFTLKKLNKHVTPISVYDWESLEKVKKILNKIQAKK
ncbi:MAG: GTPase ObgE [Parcubacteria group bacterium]|nr:GTPase ObgE [Parcubacteria group bacterium]